MLQQIILQIGNILVKNQVFGIVTNESLSTYISGKYDGVFGLGYPKGNEESLFNQMQMQGILKYKQFCFILHNLNERVDAQGVEVGGELQLGGCTVQPTVFIPLNRNDNRNGSWEFNLRKIVIKKPVGTKTLALIINSQAVMDSGCTLIVGPEIPVMSIHRALGARKGLTNRYNIDCGSVPNLPTISFLVDDKSIDISPSEYVVRSNVGIY